MGKTPKYTEAMLKDLNRLWAEVETIDAALKKNPNDANAKQARAKIMPFLQPDSLDKRWKNAMKMDKSELKKTLQDGWNFTL